MIIRMVKFETALPQEELLAIARKRADRFRRLPGLLQKYYIKLEKPNHYGGVYVWDSKEAMDAYTKSDLAASIPTAYKVVGKPSVEVIDTLFQLRD